MIVRAALAPARPQLQRFELKYWIPRDTASAIVERTRAHLRRDAHCAHDAGQWHTSLYLDTRHWTFFRQHVESLPDRFKLRVRFYREVHGDVRDGTPSDRAFVEIKRKVDAVTVKHRAAMPAALVPALLEGSTAGLDALDPASRQVVDGFLYRQAVYHAEPRVLIRCRRTSYTSIDPDENVRLTLDAGVSFQPATGTTLAHDPHAWTPLDGQERTGQRGRHVLLELKFPRLAPVWMQRLVDNLELHSVGYSKYVAAVSQLLARGARDTFDFDAAGRR